MKYATFSKSVFAVTAILVAAACANSADVPEEEGVAPTEPPPRPRYRLTSRRAAAREEALLLPTTLLQE